MDDSKTVAEKTVETLRIASKWEEGPDGPIGAFLNPQAIAQVRNFIFCTSGQKVRPHLLLNQSISISNNIGNTRVSIFQIKCAKELPKNLHKIVSRKLLPGGREVRPHLKSQE